VERRKQQYYEVVRGLKPSGFAYSANLRGREGGKRKERESGPVVWALWAKLCLSTWLNKEGLS